MYRCYIFYTTHINIIKLYISNEYNVMAKHSAMGFFSMIGKCPVTPKIKTQFYLLEIYSIWHFIINFCDSANILSCRKYQNSTYV